VYVWEGDQLLKLKYLNPPLNDAVLIVFLEGA